jgi:glycosyltransferase involved in cell wall biosynthesis
VLVIAFRIRVVRFALIISESRNATSTMTATRNAPLISVVIPCYNQARYLADAITSALGQTHKRVQIVVVDDGSVDNTAEVVARYPTVCFVRQGNQGAAEARNAGFLHSSGEYVIFLDADDRLTATGTESHLRCFAEHPEVGFVVGDIDLISGDGSYLSSPRAPDLAANQYEQLLKADHVANTIAVMFRRSVFQDVGGFDRSYSAAEDYEILLRVARVFPGAQHRSVVAQYRRHESNTSRKGASMLNWMHKVMQSQRSFVNGNPALKAAHKQGWIRWRHFYGGVTIKEIFVHLTRGHLLCAARAFAALLWYVRGGILVIPWKYRSRALSAARHQLDLLRKHSDMPQNR